MNKNIYDFEASVRNADLNALNFVGRDSISNFQGDVFMRMKGTTINDAFGTISLSNATYENQNDIYAFEDLRIQSSFDNGVRTIDINSPDVINGKVVGVFAVEEVPALFENAGEDPRAHSPQRPAALPTAAALCMIATPRH